MLDFTTARQALERLSPIVREQQQLRISFADTTRCNSAALSLLIELKAVAYRTGHELTFSHVPDGLQQLAKVCQVDHYLN